MSETIHIENSERVYPCWCGETHRGPYAAYDFGHHNCLHREPLHRLSDDLLDLVCPSCGQTFSVAPASPSRVQKETKGS